MDTDPEPLRELSVAGLLGLVSFEPRPPCDQKKSENRSDPMRRMVQYVSWTVFKSRIYGILEYDTDRKLECIREI